MTTTIRKSLQLGALACCLGAWDAKAAVIGYLSNPSGNSSDFAAGVAANGGTIQTYTFNDLSVGTLNPNAYSGLGIYFDTAATITTELSSQGSLTSPLSAGEGGADSSNHIDPGAPAYHLTINFNTPQLAAGFFLIDFYNPGSVNDAPFRAYDGLDGTGNLLGSFHPAGYNFQLDNKYFMGVLSTEANIRSITFSSPGAAGDSIYIDNLQVASTSPEPGAFWLLLGGIGLLGVKRFRR